MQKLLITLAVGLFAVPSFGGEPPPDSTIEQGLRQAIYKSAAVANVLDMQRIFGNVPANLLANYQRAYDMGIVQTF